MAIFIKKPHIVLLIKVLYLLSLTTWIGGIVFFSFVTAPSLFKSLPPEFAGKAVAAIFPKYYPLGIISGLVAFVCLIFSAAKTGSWPILKGLILIAMLTFAIYDSLVVYPKAKSLKEEMQTSTDVTVLKSEFDHTHRKSVIHNGIILILGIVLIFITARSLTL